MSAKPIDKIALSPPSLCVRRNRGFALVITFSLIILLTVIAVGLLILSSIALRTSQAGRYQSEARANARLAMMLAIGELQKELGPDQRISARASILDEDSASETPDGIANPHWLGVWDSWADWLNNPDIKTTYDKGRSKNFRRWLISSPDPPASGNFSFARSPAPADAVEMVGPSGQGNVPAKASWVRTRGNGRFAWWVTWENQKANVALAPPEAGSDAELLHDRSHWPRGRAAALAGLESAPDDAALLRRSVTLPTFGLGATDADFRRHSGTSSPAWTASARWRASNVRNLLAPRWTAVATWKMSSVRWPPLAVV